MSNLENISINDIHESELYIMWTHILSAFMLDNTEQSSTNCGISEEDRIFLKELHKILLGIDNCLKTIDISCLFLKRFYGKKYYESKDVLLADYMTYHYDMICYKTATLKDLYFKLTNHLYCLGLHKKKCNWENINSRRTIINNPILFKILESNYECLKSVVEDKRNASAHEGCINVHTLVEMELYEFLTSSNAKISIEELSALDKMQFKYKIKDAKQNLIKEATTIRCISFVLTKCIFCSLADRFSEVISDNIKDYYKPSIEKGIITLSQSKECIYCNDSGCDFWRIGD